jgi:hypothetical protein
MRPLKLTILFILTVFSAYSQKDNTDELISKLNNGMLFGTCHYNWVLENGSKEVGTLIAIGKQSGQDKTKLYLKLYDLLTDTTKGIISHYVLTNIVYANNIESGSFFYDDEDSTCEYNYNGLRFYENKYRRMFTDNSELEHNKKIWTVILKNMNVLN